MVTLRIRRLVNVHYKRFFETLKLGCCVQEKTLDLGIAFPVDLIYAAESATTG